MIFEDCKLFRDIVQSRSVSRGAALNQISQSAASQHLQELERRLDMPLLDRSVRPLEMTPAGKLYFELCRDVLRREEQFHVECARLRKEVDGSVRVISIYSIGLSEMTRLRAEFEKRFPEADLHVQYARPDRVYEAVLQDDADLGLVSYPEGGRDLTVIPWRDEVMAMAVGAESSAGREDQRDARGSGRAEFHRVRRRPEYPAAYRPVPAGCGRGSEYCDAIRQYPDD